MVRGDGLRGKNRLTLGPDRRRLSLMKTLAILAFIAGAAAAAQPTNDVAAIAAVVPLATRITETATGYRIETPTGTRHVRATSTGYRVEGGNGAETLQIIRTSTGWRVESSRGRAKAIPHP
jgi:hypothetical protein